jgi:mannose-6-phosphate isomerase-like protein (cupin superfamily)
MANVVSPREIAASLTEYWSPRVVAEVDDAYIKVAKVQGKLAWHQHENEDELFFILKGRLRIEMEDGESIELAEGQMFVVPKGVRHNPVAGEECHVMLIERKSTLHTGDVVTERTRTLAERVGPVKLWRSKHATAVYYRPGADLRDRNV